MSPKTAIKDAFRGGRLYESLAGRFHRHVGYSQFGEDLHIWSYYERLAYSQKISIASPLIVDIGAYRPVVHSNSYLFHKNGWHSINIEPTPGTMKAFKKVRPLDTNLEIAIGRNSGKSTFYLFDDKPCVWNTMDEEAAVVAQQVSGVRPRKAEIDVCRLDEVLDRHLGRRSFEILSIDAEGLDIEIIESNDFSRYKPRCILIEVMDAAASNLLHHPVVSCLAAFDYVLFSWINPNLFFVRADSVV